MNRQCYISESLEGLDFRTRYGLTDYVDSGKPLIIFGLYRPEDFDVFRNHQSEITVVWQGIDARELSPESVELLHSKKAKHYTLSHWLKESLDRYGIESEIKPISATVANLEPCTKGDFIYFYSSNNSESSLDLYGAEMLSEIRKRTGLTIIRANYGLYERDELIDIYKQCFINLRLTKYDGCPNTNLEMGLMGRRSIFNGDVPGSIKWNDVDDICENIIDEYSNRHKPETISKQVKDFLNIKFP